jgi:uncharacterized protein (TIGR02246 family)
MDCPSRFQRQGNPSCSIGPSIIANYGSGFFMKANVKSESITSTLAASLALLVVVVTHGSCASTTIAGGSMRTRPDLEEDLRAIEALTQHDVTAALTGDARALTSQWTDDFVVLPPSGPIVRGRAANAAMAEQGAEQMKAFAPVDYVVEFEETRLLGDYAYQWGTYRGSVRPRAGGQAMSYSGKLMRILQRQPNGAWKMHRTMTTSDPPSR